MEQIESHLPEAGAAALTALAQTATALSLPTPDATLIAHTLIAHTSTTQTLTNQLKHIENLQRALQSQHTALRDQLAALQTDAAFATPPQLPRQTVELGRQAKAIKGKVREAEDRVGVLERAVSSGHTRGRSVSSHIRTLSNPISSQYVSGMNSPFGANADITVSAKAIEDMLLQQEVLDALRRKVQALEAQVDEFAGLPADREGARKEVGRLEVELDELRRKRDGLFGGLLEGGRR